MYRLGYITYLLMVLSAGVTFVFLEDYESTFGISALGIGAISAVGFVVGLLTPLLAPLGDRGLVRVLGWVAFFTAILGNLWLGYAEDLTSLLVARSLGSFGTGVFSAAVRKALVGHSTEGGSEKIGTLVSFAVAGFIAGPGLGAWLFELGGFKLPYVLVAALLTVVAWPTMQWISTTPIATTATDTGRMFALLGNRRIRAAVVAQTVIFFNVGVFDSTVDEYLTDLGASNADIGWILIIIGVPLVVVPARAGRFADSSPLPHLMVLAGLIAFIPIVAAISIWALLVPFVVFAVLQTTMESLIFPSVARVILDETGAEESASGQGLVEVVGQGGAAVAAFVAPSLYDMTDGPLGSFGMSTVVGAALTAYVYWQFRGTVASRPIVAAT